MATTRQKQALKKMVANGSSDNPRPVKQILKEVGYSKAIQKVPSKVTKSQGFQELLEKEGISDEKLAGILNDGLESNNYIKTERVEGIGKGRLKTEEIKEVPDNITRHRYLETALKLKGHHKQEGASNIYVIPILGGLSVPGHISNEETSGTPQTN